VPLRGAGPGRITARSDVNLGRRLFQQGSWDLEDRARSKASSSSCDSAATGGNDARLPAPFFPIRIVSWSGSKCSCLCYEVVDLNRSKAVQPDGSIEIALYCLNSFPIGKRRIDVLACENLGLHAEVNKQVGG